MKTTEIKKGKWYRVKVKGRFPAPKYHYRKTVQVKELLARVDAKEVKEIQVEKKNGPETQKASAGWHQVSVQVRPTSPWYQSSSHSSVQVRPKMSGFEKYELETMWVHSKSVLEEAPSPLPQKGTDEYKEWIEWGIQQGKDKQDKKDQKAVIEETVERLDGFLNPDPDNKWESPLRVRTGYNKTSVMIETENSFEAAKLLAFVKKGIKAQLLDNKSTV